MEKNTKKSDKWTWSKRDYYYEIGGSTWDANTTSIRMTIKDSKGYKQSSPEVPLYAVEDFVKICADEDHLNRISKWKIIKALIKSFFIRNQKDQIRKEYSTLNK